LPLAPGSRLGTYEIQSLAVPLFDGPILARNTNDGHRWQVSPDGKRFLFVAPSTASRASPIDVIVNRQSLLAK
jgi:hypothetical protein